SYSITTSLLWLGLLPTPTPISFRNPRKGSTATSKSAEQKFGSLSLVQAATSGRNPAGVVGQLIGNSCAKGLSPPAILADSTIPRIGVRTWSPSMADRSFGLLSIRSIFPLSNRGPGNASQS